VATIAHHERDEGAPRERVVDAVAGREDPGEEDVLPVTKSQQGQRHEGSERREETRPPARLDRDDQRQDVGGQPLGRDEVGVAEELGQVVRAEGVDHAADEPRAPTAADVADEQRGEEGGEGQREDDDAVVGGGQAEEELDGEGDEAVEGVEGVQVKRHAVGGVEQRGLVGIVPRGERRAEPPVVPIVLPGILAIAGERGAEVQDEREGDDEREQQVEGEDIPLAAQRPR